MIRGRFRRGRPYVDCTIVIPRLRVNHRVALLVDTGASATCLHPADSVRARTPFDQLRNSAGFSGVGGSSPYFREIANILFEDESRLRIYRLELLIAAAAEHNRELPSLLGRDILNRWRMDYDPSNGRLEFAVRSADHTLDRL